jgi:hypothetical protein
MHSRHRVVKPLTAPQNHQNRWLPACASRNQYLRPSKILRNLFFQDGSKNFVSLSFLSKVSSPKLLLQSFFSKISRARSERLGNIAELWQDGEALARWRCELKSM